MAGVSGTEVEYGCSSEVNVRHWRILIVDDSPAMRSFIRRVIELSELGSCEIMEAENGRVALEKIERDQPNIVLTDINMPVMSGEELLETLARTRPGTPPVVVISTDSTHTRMKRMRELGAAAYLRKPFTPEGMREVFEAATLSETAR